ncbi:MAG: hypothetical protein WC209_11885 [Ignavibacteriaceae bacterium]
MKKTMIYISLFSFLYYSLSGCATPQQTQFSQNGKQNEVVVSDHTFRHSKEEVYRAGISALQKRNFMITLSDPSTGIMNGEYSSSDLLPEEMQALSKGGSQFMKACATILGIILVVGLFAEAFNSNKSSSNNNSSNNYDSNSDSRVYSHRYLASLKLEPILANETDVSLHIIRMDLENGAVVKQAEVQNQLFNKAFFSSIENELTNLKSRPN